MELLTEPREPNHVHLVWAVRKVTDQQSHWIEMFYGADALEALAGGARIRGVP